MPRHDTLSFLYAWLLDPSRTGAVAPSSAMLADVITREISATSAPVIELGPGTGVFTRALLARGLREQDLTLVETNPEFAELLQRRFPRARVLRIDAARLADGDWFTPGEVGAVVSGIPLLNLGPRKVIGILTSTFTAMRPGAGFYQFTYGPRCPVARPLLDRLGLKATRIGGALLNVPPAAVYRITRRGRSPAVTR